VGARSVVLAIAVLAAGCGSAAAGSLQDTIESRWRGAWVVTSAETTSDCLGAYSANRVNGRLVSGRSGNRFRAGELAVVDSIDLKHSRLDLRLSLAEPVLLSRQEGPFDLYDEARCRVEMQVEVPRDLVRNDDVRGIESLVRQVLDRYTTQDEARASTAYNHRRRDPYPRDYDRTLAQYTAWKAEQVNASVQAAIDRLVDETARIPDRISDDPDYMAGFVKGVEAGRSRRAAACPDLLAVSAPPRAYDHPVPAGRGSNAEREAAERQSRAARGYQDGLRLAQGLDAVRRLPGCFVQVPDQGADSNPGRPPQVR
jgi:hypothetical protein